jgi:HSP20 family protein
MISTFYNPWGELSRTWPFGSLFETPRADAGGYPKVNAWKDNDHVVLTAELPGVDAAALEVTVHNNVLTLAGELPARAKEEGETYHRNERAYGKFSRQFRLPFRADGAKTKAELKNGVLQVTVYPLAEDQPKQIAVAAN